MVFNDTRLTKQNTPLCPTLFVLNLCWLSLAPLFSTTFPLGWSPLPVKSPSGPSIDQTEQLCVPFSVFSRPCWMSLWPFQHFSGPHLENHFPNWLVTCSSQVSLWSGEVASYLKTLNNAPHSGTGMKLLR